MGRSLRHRLHAFLLLTLFVGSGTGLPALDELLYHSGREAGPPAGTAHVDPPNGCGAHAEHCVLAAVNAARQLASVEQPTHRFAIVSENETEFHWVVSLRSFDHSLLQSSRAPPARAS
jgi:hypothetical protein